MKKVLIIGPDFYGYNKSVGDAFEKCGYQPTIYSYTGDVLDTFKERIQYRLSGNKAKFFEAKKKKFNKKAIQAFNSIEPDLVFLIHGGYLYPETYKILSQKITAIWMMDSIARATDLSPLIEYVKYLFFFEKTDVEYFKNIGKRDSWFLPLALDQNVYFPKKAIHDIDILFIGALYGNRIELLNKVINTFKGKEIKIYGTYYSPLRRPFHHLFRKNKRVYLNKNIPPETVNELYSRAKVCLNIHHSQSKYGVNQRFFEISGSKAFQLVEDKPFIVENFSNNEICTYKNESDMLEKMKRALEDEEWRSQTANNAYLKVTQSHTFYHRVHSIVQIIEDAEK